MTTEIPIDIIILCAAFSDYLRYHWRLTPVQPVTGEYFAKITSPIVSFEGIHIQMTMTQRTDDGNEPDLIFELKPIKLDDNIKSVTLRFKDTLMMNDEDVWTGDYKPHETWSNDGSYGSLKSYSFVFGDIPSIKDINLIQFEIYPEIFDIRYKDEQKKFDKHVKLHQRLQYRWYIGGSTCQLFKTARNGQYLNSPFFGNWTVRFRPKMESNVAGITVILLSLPTLVRSIAATISVRYKDQERMAIRKNCRFGFQRDHGSKFSMEAVLDDTVALSSDLFCKLEQLFWFTVDIEIIDVVEWDRKDEFSWNGLSKSHWEKYDIINKSFISEAWIKLNRKVRYKWEIDQDQLKLFKTTQAKFTSSWFERWRLSFTPYGSDGYTSMKLEMQFLPPLIKCIVAKIRFRYQNQNGESDATEHKFGFEQHHVIMHANWKKETLLSAELYGMNSLYFIVDIEIIKVYKWSDPDKSAPIYEWESCGIINETYTNIRPKHEQKEEKNIGGSESNVTQEQIDQNGNRDVLNLILNKLSVLDTMQADIAKIKQDVEDISERLTKLENINNNDNDQ